MKEKEKPLLDLSFLFFNILKSLRIFQLYDTSRLIVPVVGRIKSP